jgi:hypothetical protein
MFTEQLEQIQNSERKKHKLKHTIQLIFPGEIK